jgi:hypothetical protein
LIKNRTRDNIEIDVYSPSSVALPVARPKISQDVVDLLDKCHIYSHPSYKLKDVLSANTLEFESAGNEKEHVN